MPMASPETDTATSPRPAEHGGLRRETQAGDPVTLAESLMDAAGWTPESFSQDGPNPPYVRIGGKLWVTLSEYEPCFSSARRDRGLFRSKVSVAGHLEKYEAIMVDPLAFEARFGLGEGTEATFPFGAWLTVKRVGFEGVALWGRRQGEVTLPLAALSVASAIWLRPRAET